MADFFKTVTGVAIALVFIVLIAGVVNMMRGTSPNRSQLLMRWRVALQFTAIVAMMVALYLSQHFSSGQH